MRRHRALLIINPIAHHAPSPDRLSTGNAWLLERGWLVEQTPSRGSDHTVELAAVAAQQGYDCVIACGGDGTISAALNGVVGTNTALAAVPGGMANVWAKEVRLPHDPVAALQLVETGERRRIDVGTVSGRSFLLMASAGLDSLAIARVSLRTKRRFAHFAYVQAALDELRDYRGRHARIDVDGQRFDVAMLAFIASNTRSYGGVLEITPDAQVDDGLLDVAVFEGIHRSGLIAHLLRTVRRRQQGNANVLFLRGRRITIESDEPLPIQIDGDLAGTTPATIELRPQAATVIVPPGLSSPLWSVNMPP